ncbi:hypothetical protein, partial [Xanthomonas oryzae]|uniref:hypothetical protein n=1 Tax=Xanthomonas oryzae TaxID=347 RepID=UPI001C4A9F1A
WTTSQALVLRIRVEAALPITGKQPRRGNHRLLVLHMGQYDMGACNVLISAEFCLRKFYYFLISTVLLNPNPLIR